MKVIIERKEYTEQGTSGVLYSPSIGFFFFFIELPWRDNEKRISCIPTGEYVCERYFSKSFSQYLYRVCDVPNRTGIAFHSGNVAGNTDKGYKTHSLGCILPGKKQGVLWGQKAVLLSRLTIGTFFRLLDKKPFELIIKET